MTRIEFENFLVVASRRGIIAELLRVKIRKRKMRARVARRRLDGLLQLLEGVEVEAASLQRQPEIVKT